MINTQNVSNHFSNSTHWLFQANHFKTKGLRAEAADWLRVTALKPDRRQMEIAGWSLWMRHNQGLHY